MKRALAPLWLVVLLGAHAAPAAAAPFAGTLSFGVPAFSPTTASLLGAGSGVSQPGLVTVPGGVLSGMATVPAAGVPAIITRFEFDVAGNLAGALAGTPLQGAISVHGVSRVWIYGGFPTVAWSVPLFTGHTVGSGAGAVGLGVGGQQELLFTTSPDYVKLDRKVWQVGMVTLTGLATNYTYHAPSGMSASMIVTTIRFTGTDMFTGSDARTPSGAGQVTLVSPTRVRSSPNFGQLSYAVSATLTLQFVPEPTTLLLLGAGIAALAAFGGRRLSRCERE